jgi:hypothetical protein
MAYGGTLVAGAIAGLTLVNMITVINDFVLLSKSYISIDQRKG